MNIFFQSQELEITAQVDAVLDQPLEQAQWQIAFSASVKSLEELLEYLNLTKADISLPQTQDLSYFPLRVPLAYLAKIEKGNPLDPLLLQILPTAKEFELQPGYTRDPLEESRFNPVPGVIHKYPNRILLIITQACAIHCRYCFRRHFPYEQNALTKIHLQSAIDYVQGNPAIDEVILSGGDPMSLHDQRLLELLQSLCAIKHVQRVRIHSRLLATLPERVTDTLLAGFAQLRIPLVIVVHVNHPNEIDDAFASAITRLRQIGVHVLNQSVLLAGINDSVSTLKDLNTQLFNAGVMPYYLHLLDPVEGASHFDVSKSQAKALMKDLLATSPGYLVPKLVAEMPGLASKCPIDINFITN